MIALTQTWALLVDAYRELNAKKLFWLAIGINAIVIGVFASLGIGERGVTFWHWSFDNPVLTTALVSREAFYKAQFVAWGVPFLNWASTILALVSTAAMVPDLISGGSVETMLSRPMGRVRLLLTKFATGLLFVALQVGVFSVGCVAVIWVRGGSFTPKLLWAVPLVVVFYSYLFSVCVLLGLLTRSTVAALLLTVLFWVMLWALNLADGIFLVTRSGFEVRLEEARQRLVQQEEFADRRLAAMEAASEPVVDTEGAAISGADARRDAVNMAMPLARQRVRDLEQSVRTWTRWSNLVTTVKTPLPKTGETLDVLQRSLITQEELERIMRGDSEEIDPADLPEDAPVMADPRAQARAAEIAGRTSNAWILGTSLGFEAVVLGVSCLIFARRDF